MDSKRIKIAANEMLISEQQDNITRTIKMMNEILEIWKEQGVKLTDEEINSLIRSTFGGATIEKIASARSSKLRPRQQLEEFTSWVDDIKLAFRIYPGLELSPFSYYAYYEKGKMHIKEGAFEEIADHYTYYITEQKDIELYNRHQKLIEESNKLSEEIRLNTGVNRITSAWLFGFGSDGTAFAPNTFMYGK
ncbi:hypothetical protein SAMN05444360_102183 [Chryseobacterium carnipullorum]|uniref:hypothetical protein n=1 Tax=Chryseobacterium carnipullorum TaxID=1124835 RepID=UPI00091E7B34|nr:hypothetical protein [Chryseobacterium carnipullorum]SHL52438.1 hypothetical protein SAMN05444360_102183 [Chryseobacterium carnipullorum]